MSMCLSIFSQGVRPVGAKLLPTVALAWALASPVGAQVQSRWAVTGAIEFAHVTEDDGFLGKGPGWTAGVEHWLTDRTSVALEAGQQRHVRRSSFRLVDPDIVEPAPLLVRAHSEGTATYVMGSVARQFGSARARPVIWGGAGVMHHPGTRSVTDEVIGLPPGGVLPPRLAERRGRAVTALALDGGAGVDVLATDRLAVRPYLGLRLIGTGNEGPKYVWRTGVRLSWGLTGS